MSFFAFIVFSEAHCAVLTPFFYTSISTGGRVEGATDLIR